MKRLLLSGGAYNRRAIMDKAHAEFRASRWRGDGWSFSRCFSLRVGDRAEAAI